MNMGIVIRLEIKMTGTEHLSEIRKKLIAEKLAGRSAVNTVAKDWAFLCRVRINEDPAGAYYFLGAVKNPHELVIANSPDGPKDAQGIWLDADGEIFAISQAFWNEDNVQLLFSREVTERSEDFEAAVSELVFRFADSPELSVKITDPLLSVPSR
jgi:hypothetical protein